jgi:hypothetical protein
VLGDVARGGCGTPDHADDAEQDQKRMARAGGGHGSDVQGHKEAPEATKVARKSYRGQRVRLSITARRVRIDPRKKRRSYIRRLERLMRECDRIISNPEGYEELQVKAMAILIRSIVVCYDLVTDEQVEALEEEFEALKRRIAEKNRAGKPEA